MSLWDMSAVQARDAVQSGEVSATEMTQALLSRIQATDGALHAYLHVLSDSALKQAARIDRMDETGRQSLPLAGVPVAVKDNMALDVGPTTAGSRILEGFQAPYAATVVTRLRAAGAVIVGKTNLDEFAMGSSTEHSAYGVTRNPWNLDRVPGGSSGGSAAAVAARSATAALGSDTGGSIRQPAAFCGVVGIKPTYGRVSRYGLLAFASSLDQIGPFTRTVGDGALLLSVIAGHDPMDATSLSHPVPSFQKTLGQGAEGMVVGVPEEYLEGLSEGVRASFQQALAKLEAAGAVIRPVRLAHTAYAISAYYLIAPAEASSNLARYDGVRFGYRKPAPDLLTMYQGTRGEGFGTEVKRRIMLGTYALSAGYYDAFYLKAQKVRTVLVKDFEQAFTEVDVLATPTTPETAFRIGEKTQDPWQMYLSDVLTVGVNLAGLPALSMPGGLSQGLPVGVQLIAPWLEEERMLRAARALELQQGPLPWPDVPASEVE